MGWSAGPALFLGWVGITLAHSLAPLLFAFGLKPLVDGVVSHDAGSLVTGGVLCGLALAILTAIPPAQQWITSRVRERLIMAFQLNVLNMAANAPSVAHFERPEFLDRLQLLTNSSGRLLEGTANALVGPLILGQLIVTAATLSRLAPWLLLLPAVAIPVAALNQRAERRQRSAEDAVAERRRTTQHLFALASRPTSAKELRVFGLESELTDRHQAMSTDIHRTIERAGLAATLTTAGGWLLLALTFIGGASVALRSAATGDATAGDVVLTLALAAAVVGAAARLSTLAGQLQRAVSTADHYRWLEDQLPPASPAAAVTPVLLQRGFALENVTFRYPGTETPAIDEVTLRLHPGQVVALVGENGAGKTTLVKLLSRMYAPDAGVITLDGTDVTSFDIVEYRSRLSAGFQDFARFELLLRESVGVGDLQRIDDIEAVRDALDRSNADFAGRLPVGLETQLGRSWSDGVDLSGGEWQKIALARAMLRAEPLLVAFDEPTSSLDPQTEHALFEQIASYSSGGSAAGRVTLLVSHRFSTVRMADHIIVLERGRILEQGTHAELIEREGLYAELYELQARAYQ